MKSNFADISVGISEFIVKWLSDKGSFETRSFYGESFTLALLQREKLLDKLLRKKLIESYKALDKNDSQFHWEFNNYALFDYFKQTNDKEIEQLIFPLNFKNTPCTNWTLLRSNIRLSSKVDTKLALKEAREKISNYQQKSGLILDDKGVKSFQYHCFSIAMIGEMFELTDDNFFRNSFLKGVEFIRKFILLNGESLYIGRGQNQSFGYGALVYILSLGYKFTTDTSYLSDIELTVSYLRSHSRDNGSFPLVINGLESRIPKVIDMKDKGFAGWYPYNNYFDYLPFLGYFLNKACEVLVSAPEPKKTKSRIITDYQDQDFLLVNKNNYQAVISKTGGYWTNDMSIPYIVARGQSITPMYGGEQFQNSFYSLADMPLPYCKLLKKSIRWKAKSFLKGKTLWVVSPLGVMRRKYTFKDDEVVINTSIFSLFSFEHIYLLLDKFKDKYIISEEASFKGSSYSASGELLKFCTNSLKSSEVKIKV